MIDTFLNIKTEDIMLYFIFSAYLFISVFFFLSLAFIFFYKAYIFFLKKKWWWGRRSLIVFISRKLLRIAEGDENILLLYIMFSSLLKYFFTEEKKERAFTKFSWKFLLCKRKLKARAYIYTTSYIRALTHTKIFLLHSHFNAQETVYKHTHR